MNGALPVVSRDVSGVESGFELSSERASVLLGISGGLNSPKEVGNLGLGLEKTGGLILYNFSGPNNAVFPTESDPITPLAFEDGWSSDSVISCVHGSRSVFGRGIGRRGSDGELLQKNKGHSFEELVKSGLIPEI